MGLTSDLAQYRLTNFNSLIEKKNLTWIKSTDQTNSQQAS